MERQKTYNKCHREVVYLFFFSNFLDFFNNFLGRTPGHGTGGPGCTSATGHRPVLLDTLKPGASAPDFLSRAQPMFDKLTMFPLKNTPIQQRESKICVNLDTWSLFVTQKKSVGEHFYTRKTWAPLQSAKFQAQYKLARRPALIARVASFFLKKSYFYFFTITEELYLVFHLPLVHPR